MNQPSYYPFKLAVKIAFFGILVPLLCINALLMAMYQFGVDGELANNLLWIFVIVIPITYGVIFFQTVDKFASQTKQIPGQPSNMPISNQPISELEPNSNFTEFDK